jgi:hypothetical protein
MPDGSWSASRKARRRAARAEENRRAPEWVAALKAEGFDVVELSPGHLRVGGVADWRPSAGSWRFLDGSIKGRGVPSLLRTLRARASR